MRRRIAACAAALTALAGVAPVCLRAQLPVTPSKAPAWTRSPLAAAESAFQETRRIHDRMGIARSTGLGDSANGAPQESLDLAFAVWRARLDRALAAASRLKLNDDDRRALAEMQRVRKQSLTPFAPSLPETGRSAPDCAYDPIAVARKGVEVLRAHMLDCYALAARSVRVGDSTFNRLGVLGRLGWTTDPARRRTLWLALDTVWRAMNGDDSPNSPWRTLIRLSAPKWAGGNLPANNAARTLGLDPALVERWLIEVMERWRDATPSALVEPWDFYYENGAASRALASRIPRERLVALNRAYFTAVGADPDSLHVHYDIDPRPAKKPLAFTDFGERPRYINGAWTAGQPWVFGIYADGGLDILNELLHETGHAVHIAAIRTRPAFTDWPDSDPFTEGIADVLALDVYEPAWQQRWLGDTVTLAEGIRARYGAIILDVAWSLFEIRMHRDPAGDPNVVWTELTNHYLHIVPHPERSWWAARAQLFDLPGYMLNYALGAFLVADVRDAFKARYGDWITGDPAWYGRMRDALYQYGRERDTRTVLTNFLGRPMRADALLRDISRMGGGTTGAPAYDLVIRNGTVIDGTGDARFRADVGVVSGRVVVVSRTALPVHSGTQEIDATGRIVAPGFIDLHAHIDGLFRMPDAASHVRQGVTLALGGPDGGGPSPFGSYVDAVARLKLGMNVAFLTGHNRIRSRVMGAADRVPTAAELAKMADMVRAAMHEGAFGLSTGLQYVPGAYAHVDELVALSRAASDSGGIYTSHVRDEGRGLIASVAEALEIGRRANVPVVLTHHKAIGTAMWGKSTVTLAMVDSARFAHTDVMLDVYPYTASSTVLGVMIPAWAYAGGRAAFVARTRDPVLRDSILLGIVDLLEHDRGGDLKRVQFASVAWQRSLEGKTLYDWTVMRGLPPTSAAAAPLVIEGELNGGASMIYHVMDEGDVKRILAHPMTAVASDGTLTRPGAGMPHPRSYGTFPRVLGHYVRDEHVITLEDAVRKMTSLPAWRLGLVGRGCLRAQCAADITIFDAATIADRGTYTNPHQYPVGIDWVIVNGVPVVAKGAMTLARPGRVLRRGEQRN